MNSFKSKALFMKVLSSFMSQLFLRKNYRKVNTKSLISSYESIILEENYCKNNSKSLIFLIS